MPTKAANNAIELGFISFVPANNSLNFTANITTNGTAVGGEDLWVRTQANAAFAAANNVGPQIQPAFDTANSAALYANAAFNAANNASDSWVRNQANLAFNKANSAAQYSSNTAVTDFFALPFGTTAQRPASAANGHMRYNTTLNQVEVYLSSNGWTNMISDSFDVEFLATAGGGAGGWDVGGGGGAGGLIFSTVKVTPRSSYSITIGAGGASNTVAYPTSTASAGPGANTTVFGQIAIGGGGGGNYNGGAGAPGGSGGGGSGWSGAFPGGSGNAYGAVGQGNPGGTGVGSNGTGAGGGGAGGAGPNGQASTTSPVSGGPGLSYSISGSPVTYAYGGQGGADSGPDVGGTTAPANLGAGGNGAGGTSNRAANGGSGVVIIRYPGAQRANGGTIVSTGGYTIHTFTGSGTFFTN